MNWLALKALKERYMVEDGPEKARAEKVYGELRKNVVDNVFKVSSTIVSASLLRAVQEWKRTGYVWEQYDAETGEGRRR
jgi:mannosyl-oligosaccharide glucosidase